MKKLGFVLLLAVMMVSFNSCINVVEVIKFKKNGSGSYSITYDLGGMVSMLQGVNLGQMLGGEEGDESAPDISTQLPKMMDTTVYARNMLKATGKWNDVDRKDIWETAKVNTVINQDKGVMDLTMSFDFKEASDINYFQSNMGKLTANEENPAMDGMAGMLGGMNGAGDFSFKKRTFKRTTAKNAGEKPALTDEMKQQMEMMKMMLSDAKYRTVYHFPKKIKSTNFKDVIISKDKKTVTVETDLLDLMDNADALNGEVKLKRW